MSTSRRAFLGGLAAAAFTGATGYALARRPGGPDVLRVGAMANLTHAPMLAGLGSGRIQAALAPRIVETRIFRAGPRVAEALIGGAIDAGTAGPSAIVVHHARHRDSGHGLRVISGCASGGASLVVTKKSGIRTSEDVHGKRLAVTQIGTAQDVSLRWWLRNAGLRDATAGGDVVVLAIAGATILDQMKRGELDGAWLPEPWATRVVRELGAIRLLDERNLWPDGRFATAVLATLARDAETDWAPKLAAALADEVSRALHNLEHTLDEAHAELTRRIGNPGQRSLFTRASAFVDFTDDPLRGSIERFGEAATTLGLSPPDATTHLFRD